jgi:hypothetical protein
MKSKLLSCLLPVLLLAGCASANFTAGRDFDSSAVSRIAKGKTTSAELLAWMGAPYNKTINSDGSQAWMWLYSQGKSHAQSYVFTMDVKTEMTGKQLVATLRGEVVQDFVFTDGPMGGGQIASGVGM